VCCVVTVSCRPFQRSAQLQHVYELVGGELFVYQLYYNKSHDVALMATPYF